MPTIREALSVNYFFDAKERKETIREIHWKRKRGKPKSMLELIVTFEIGGMYFTPDGEMCAEVLKHNYTPQTPNNRRIYPYDIAILWAIAACPKKTLGYIESMLAGRVKTDKSGKLITPVLMRSDIVDAIHRLDTLGIVSGILPKEK
jgi:hypothetical protein